MNPKILITSIFVTSLIFTSCKKELEPQENTPTSELVKLGLAKDTTKTQQSVVQNPAANPNTVMGATQGINPAHGQPGHRCDIAVGAPLNSAPTQQVQTTNTQTAQPVQVNAGQQQVVTTTATPVKVAKGMNPPHGQPGHRCDIPVGSPLNSPVAKQPAANTAQSGTTSQNFTVTPPPANNAVPALLSTEETAVADGMNPAHGKPGHRCDIAVGAPLPKS
ncbi:hypothetical protein [Flavobacterium sp. SLB02]|uniref:hypothetical protein n=1 Tax=Flavobacterium sp. SLB02 TaxID=2665645 RepID=UPI0012A95182|nr:hypothetical protein [Flavobacterium sp. SLB02]QGK75936.1 hypothetical protein GIY83_18240 [Flavobacterium sp. SLB02]